MRTIRVSSLLTILITLLILQTQPIALAQQPTQGQITQRGVIDCFDEGLQNDEGNPVYCETSAVVYDGSTLTLASDKGIPGEGRSPVFSFPYPGSGLLTGSLTYLTAPPLVHAIKYEDMALTPDGQYIIASTGFDRVQGDSNAWDGYNTLLMWPVGDPDAVQVVAASDNDGVTSSVGLRDEISQALANDEFPDGMPYFKVEGMTTIPGDRLLFGIRELGAKYDDFEYAVKIIAAPYQISEGQMSLTGGFELIYDYEPDVQPTVALSSIEYDIHHERLYMLTSFETEETDEGLGAYLWTLPLADLDTGQAPARVHKDDGDPLLFAHKAEGITVLSADLVFVIHDDDRVLGREDVSDPETQFSRDEHQAAYTLVSLSVVVPQTLPESGGAEITVYVWLIALGGLAVSLGLGITYKRRRACLTIWRE